MRRDSGRSSRPAGVQTDKTAEALKEFFIELTRIHEPVTAGELEKAKNYLALQMPRNFETTRDARPRSPSCTSTTCRRTTTPRMPTAFAR